MTKEHKQCPLHLNFCSKSSHKVYYINM